jgi:hypothetical protein
MGGFDMNGPERILSSSELCRQWGWSDEDFVEALRMGLRAYEPATKRALSADDIPKLGESVASGRKIDVRCKLAEVEQFKRDHPGIFPRGVKPRRPKRRPTVPLRMSVETVAERWSCSVDLIRLLVADGLLSPPEGAGPEGWFDREAFQDGDDTRTSDFEMFKAERVWAKSAGWKSEAIRKFEKDHPEFFERDHLTSVPEGTRSSPPSTPVERSGLSPRTDAKQLSPAKGGASPADEPTPATARDVDKPTPATASGLARDAANAREEITTEDLEAAVEVAVEMCRWWEKQPENGKRPMTEAIAHVKKVLSHLCNKMSDTRLGMIAGQAKPKTVGERPGRRN